MKNDKEKKKQTHQSARPATRRNNEMAPYSEPEVRYKGWGGGGAGVRVYEVRYKGGEGFGGLGSNHTGSLNDCS